MNVLMKIKKLEFHFVRFFDQKEVNFLISKVLLIKSFFSVLFSSEQIYDNLLCLGSITNVFFIDRDGVLSDVKHISNF